MPLRDHFHSPISDEHSFDALHAAWPTTIVMALKRKLPNGYVALPHVRMASLEEIDVASFNRPSSTVDLFDRNAALGDGGTALWAPPMPTLDVTAELPEQDEYEVRVYDNKHGRRLVAAVEIVSPGNKDRTKTRRDFVDKCASLLKQQVSVAIIDVVTERHANLYGELLEAIGQSDPMIEPKVPYIYASECRWDRSKRPARFQTWTHALVIGEPLPTLPLWLTPDLAVPLELEPTYEEACNIVSIT